MEQTLCPHCGAGGFSEGYIVDRYGVSYWFRQCAYCGCRWSIRHSDPAYDNPYIREEAPAWHPEPTPPLHF